MTPSHCRRIVSAGPLVLLIILPCLVRAQDVAKTNNASASEKKITKGNSADSLDAQRRTFAISLVISLADEARSFHDQALRPHVLAGTADMLWNADTDTARQLFRRAWAAAEAGDAEDLSVNAKDGAPPVVIALRRISGRDLRAAVLALAARRDRALADEFFNKLTEDRKREAADSKEASSSRNETSDSWILSDAASKRFQVAEKLLEDGQIERALQVAGPALNQVNQKSIGFLCALRQRTPQAADQRFLSLLNMAEFDPLSDANTASGLSSYVFTPGFYVTFSADGGARWTPSEQLAAPLNLPSAIRDRFFRAAANILLRPSPPPDQDFSSSGRTGKYMVIKRLLPLFDQYAPDSAAGLRAQLSMLTDNSLRNWMSDEASLLTRGVQPEETTGSALEKLQDRLDRAKTSQERDWIYADAASVLSSQGDPGAQDLADKISDSERRDRVRGYVDFELVHFAIRQKKESEVVRLAKTGKLTYVQRAFAYTQAALMIVESEPTRSQDLLDEATSETRRIAADDPDRARLLIAVANQVINSDRVRAWELMGEVVKSANAAEKFTGDSSQLHFSLATRRGLRSMSIGGREFGVAAVFRSLARDDLYRSIDLAKGFKRDAPRANAILAIAGAVLEKQ